VGEGTGLKLDLDEYDLYYKQLILWDNEQQKIAGGYRIGMGDYIIEHYGVKGFYTRSLFKMDKQLLPIFRQSAELGRSYIPREYQQKRLPLFLLWRGILAFLMRNQQCRYLFGPVSISNKYSNISKNLIIEFIKKNHFDESIAQFVKPRKKFKAEIKNLDIDILVESAADDIKLIDKYIQDFDPEMNGVPILLKKYLNQNAKIVGFNIDPKFSDALDGLMFLDLKEVPLDTLDGLK
jgi:putative hemolysin